MKEFLLFQLNESDAIEFNVWDQDPLKSDDFMGMIKVPLSDLSSRALFDESITLQSRPDNGDKVSGALHIQILFSDSEDVNDYDFKHPLHSAVKKGLLSAVEYLLAKSTIDVNQKDSEGLTVLYIATKKNEVGIAKLLISKKANLNILDSHGQSPLFLACSTSPTIAEKLIEAGASLDFVDSNQETVLHVVCGKGHLEILTLLFDNKVDLTLQTKEGFTAFHLIFTKQSNEEAAVQTIKLFFDRGYDVNAVTANEGYTALHLCVIKGNETLPLVKTLLDYCKAKLNIKDKEGNTPIDLANKKEDLSPEFKKFLSDHESYGQKITEAFKPLNILGGGSHEAHHDAPPAQKEEQQGGLAGFFGGIKGKFTDVFSRDLSTE